MGYDQYTVPDDDCSYRTYFCCFPLELANIFPWPLVPFFQISLKSSEFKTTQATFRDCRVHFFRQPFSKKTFLACTCNFCFPISDLVMVPQRTFFFQISSYARTPTCKCIINEKTKGQFRGERHMVWIGKTKHSRGEGVLAVFKSNKRTLFFPISERKHGIIFNYACIIHILSSHEYLVNLSMPVIALPAYTLNICVRMSPGCPPRSSEKKAWDEKYKDVSKRAK